MGAIAGLTGTNDGAIDRMIEAMQHRCVHGSSVAQPEPGVALAHGAAWTVPGDSLRRQPLYRADAGVWTVADARIDNRAQIRNRLRLHEDITDAEIILHAYLAWGRDCPQYLMGDFAFAIWDGRRKHFFCARDHIGIKPLYFAHIDGCFGFATEVQAIRAGFDRSFSPNHERIAEYLSRQAISADTTMFAEIHRLPPAHCLTYDLGGNVAVSCYWSIDSEREVRYASDAQYEDEFRSIFTTAVEDRLLSRNPSGVMLSGGLDSSSVACVARDMAADRNELLTTFTGQFGYAQSDESPYLDALEQQGGLDMRNVDLHGVDPLDSVDSVVQALGQPPYICNAYMYASINAAAREAGIDVLLDGCEGDVSVSYGLGRLGEFVLSGAWPSLDHELGALAQTTAAPTAQLFRQHAEPFLPARLGLHPTRFLKNDVWHAARIGRRSALRLLARTSKMAWKSWQGVGAPLPQSASLVSRDLIEQTRLVERIQDSRPAIAAHDFSERRRHWWAIHHEAPGIATIQEEANHLHAMHGGEARHPFYDVRLIEYCVGLPSDQKLRDGYTRSILRRSLRHTLPDIIQRRMTKGDLSENFVRTVSADSSGRIRDMIEDRGRDLEDYIDLTALNTARKSGDAPSLYTALSFLAWKDNVLHAHRASPARQQVSGSVPEIAMS
jgi:asparagine synthase (glutamine-hydrolysing)